MPTSGPRRRALALGTALTVLALVLVRSGAPGSFIPHTAPPDSPRASAAATGRPPSSASASVLRGVPADPAGQVAGLLTQRGAAVMSHDLRTWLGVLASQPSRFRTSQERVFGRITALAPQAWTYRFLSASALTGKPASGSPQGWSAQVELSYRLTAGGPLAVRIQYLTIVPATATATATATTTATAAGTAGRTAGATAPGRWRIAGDTAGATDRDVWDLGPISVARASRCVVIASTTWRRLSQRVAQTCTASARRVDAVWGRNWPVRTVLVIPASQDQLATLLGRTDTVKAAGALPPAGSPGTAQAGLDQTAAVTIGPASGAAEQVLVNPAVFNRLQLIGFRVIITHELVHVATRATGSLNAPTWLAEGFADYVGYSGSGLSPHQIAGDALDRVRRGRIPTSLPADADFDAARPGAAAAYGFGWAATTTIARSGGVTTLAAFYRAASGTSGSTPARVDRAVRDVLHLSGTPALVSQWQRELRMLAG